jgi:hypothetical protein
VPVEQSPERWLAALVRLAAVMRGAAVLAVAVASLLGAPGSAEAGIVRVIPLHERDAVEYRDNDGIADDLRVSAAGRTILVSGPGVVAGTGCATREGGAACAVQVMPPYVRASLGGGDDRMVVEEPVAADVFAGPGNDAVRVPWGSLEGETGNDLLELTGGIPRTPDGDAAGPARLLGQDGDDRLIAGGAPTEIAGGPGRDAIVDSPFGDVIVGADDAGAADSIECRGSEDYIERDPVDAMVRCDPKPLNRLTRIRYRWAFYRNGTTVFRTLAVAYPGLAFNQGRLFAECRGRGCRGARLRVLYRGAEFEPIRIVSGGVRAPGGRRRGLRPGATVFIGFEIRVGDVAFRKGTEFRTRRRAVPRHRKLCQTRVTGGRWRTVRCDRP